jgi:dipeptidyl-peptidase-4
LTFGLSLATGFLSAEEEARPAEEYERITLEDTYSRYSRYMLPGPRPRQISWKPDGSSFYYFSNGKGGKEDLHDDEKEAKYLWYYDCVKAESARVAEWSAVQDKLDELATDHEVAAVKSDVDSSGRFDRSAMSLSPDGGTFLGSHSNDLYLYDIASGEARFVTSDAEAELFATFSPDMQKIAFVRDKDLHLVDLGSSQVRRLTDRGDNRLLFNGIADWVYEEELDLHRSFWWSEDSGKIAFLQFDTSPIKTFPIVDSLVGPVAHLEQQQYPKSGEPNSIVRLGVIDVASGKTSWIDSGEETDVYLCRVGWVPGSGELWYLWLNRDQTRVELRFADPETGESRLVLADEDPAWIGWSVRRVTFVDDSSLIWASEQDGWQHLYLYSTDGTLRNQITSGEWDVTDIYGLDPDASSLVYSSTEVCPMERHLYRINLDGSSKQQLSQEEGTHNADMPDRGAFLIHTYSGVGEPYMTLRRIDGTEVHTFQRGQPEEIEHFRISPTEYFTISAEDGATLYCSMVKPHDFDPNKKYPVLVYIYGGPGSQMVRKQGYVSMSTQLLAQEGIITFRLDNRGTSGRGRDWNRIVHRQLGYWELKDHVDGVKYLKTLPYVDGDRIAIRGGSYGGYMVLYAMTRAPEHFQVGLAGAPVTDWALYDTIYTERFMDTPEQNPDGYRDSSPLNFAENLTGKLLLSHGFMDNNVHLQNTTKMIDALIKADKDFDLLLLPQERHGTRTPYRRKYSNRRAYEFLMRHLLGAQSPESKTSDSTG